MRTVHSIEITERKIEHFFRKHVYGDIMFTRLLCLAKLDGRSGGVNWL